MNDFSDFRTEGMGGLADQFAFAPINTILSIPIAKESIITSAITFTSGNNFLVGKSIMNALEFDEKQTASPAGDVYTTVISGMVSQLTPEYLNLFREMTKQRFVVVTTDNNGLKRISGNKLAGMRFGFDQTASTTPAGVAGFKFSFSLVYHQASLFYEV